jgi:GDP-4-dehydro-6-deoxy-D-mannose reductase
VRVLITGASGFAGSHLVRACAAGGDEVVALSRSGPAGDDVRSVRQVRVDLRDAPALRQAVRDAAPDVVYHLAALSSVGRSWEDPAATLEQNGVSAVALLEAVRHEAPSARLLWVSSCEVYGGAAELPIGEQAPPAPANPYAVSKAAGEMLARVYADAYGLHLIVARPFNHAGPGQRDIFLLSSLARQGAQGKLEGASRLVIVTGNPETRRDFTDVRDVVRAYRLLAAGAPAGTYNVSTGRSISAREQVELLGELLAPIEVVHEVDPARVRAHEVMDLRGSHELLTRVTGWEPQIPFRRTMADSVEWWERRLARTIDRAPA